jgi:hypothetical protein
MAGPAAAGEFFDVRTDHDFAFFDSSRFARRASVIGFGGCFFAHAIARPKSVPWMVQKRGRGKVFI